MSDSINYGARVSINTASADEIQQALHGVGPVMARDIVGQRHRTGPFRRPDDLARVRGIGARMAVTLSHQIDWSVPHPALPRQVWQGITAILATATCAGLGAVPLRQLLRELRRPLDEGGPDGWRMGMYGVCVAMTMTGAAWTAATVVRSFSTRRERAERAARFGAWAALLLAVVLLAGTAGLIASAPGYWPGGAGRFFRSSHAWLVIATTVMMDLMIAPGLIVRWKPGWSRKPWVEMLHNAATALAALVFLWASWVTRVYQPWWVRSGYLVLGCYLLYRSARIVSGRSYFDPDTYAAIPGAGNADDPDRLLRWLNEKLPDPHEQTVLWKVLARRHGPGRLRTGIGHALYMITSWLVLNGRRHS